MSIGYLQQALVISREFNDRRNEGANLGNLGRAYAAQGNIDKAIPLLEQAIEIGRAIKDPQIEDFYSEHLDELKPTPVPRRTDPPRG